MHAVLCQVRQAGSKCLLASPVEMLAFNTDLKLQQTNNRLASCTTTLTPMLCHVSVASYQERKG